MAAFAKFGSDRLTELLKQAQFQPLPVKNNY
jgi:hypothetical protein